MEHASDSSPLNEPLLPESQALSSRQEAQKEIAMKESSSASLSKKKKIKKERSSDEVGAKETKDTSDTSKKSPQKRARKTTAKKTLKKTPSKRLKEPKEAPEQASNETLATEEDEKLAKKQPIHFSSGKVLAVKKTLPQTLSMNALRQKPLAEIYAMLEVLPLRIPAQSDKSGLIAALVGYYASQDVVVTCEGIVEQARENYAMLRDISKSFKPSKDDIYIHGSLIKRYGLRVGDAIKVTLRVPKSRDKYLSAQEVVESEGAPIEEGRARVTFDGLTAMFPNERLILEHAKTGVTPRIMDLMTPLGKGARGLVVAPPRGGKTIVLKKIAQSIRLNSPEVKLLIVLLDERPEEVTDFEETVDAEVFSSTFDESSRRHAQVADLVLERAKRLVEAGHDVVLLLDSLTRLARGHNNAQRGGPIGSGGLSSIALQKSRKFFGSARNCEEGGSLTILATALIETENRMDDVVFEEFKGTGNMELHLDGELASKRIFPAIHLPKSGTRNDDRLYHPKEMEKVLEIRRQLASLPVGDALMTLIKNLQKTQNNTELLLRGLQLR